MDDNTTKILETAIKTIGTCIVAYFTYKSTKALADNYISPQAIKFKPKRTYRHTVRYTHGPTNVARINFGN